MTIFITSGHDTKAYSHNIQLPHPSHFTEHSVQEKRFQSLEKRRQLQQLMFVGEEKRQLGTELEALRSKDKQLRERVGQLEAILHKVMPVHTLWCYHQMLAGVWNWNTHQVKTEHTRFYLIRMLLSMRGPWVNGDHKRSNIIVFGQWVLFPFLFEFISNGLKRNCCSPWEHCLMS